MDDRRFDNLARTLAGGASRRRVVAAALGGAAAALLGRRDVGAGRPRPAGATCIRASQCATGICDPRARRCLCPAGLTNCGGDCVDVQTDLANCGACDVACFPGLVCPAGACVACTDPFVCDGTGGICGTDCICVSSVSGSQVCSDDFFCGDECTTNEECATALGAGAVCQSPDSGCCGQRCIVPCGTDFGFSAASVENNRQR